jgi:hypothetical protein
MITQADGSSHASFVTSQATIGIQAQRRQRARSLRATNGVLLMLLFSLSTVPIMTRADTPVSAETITVDPSSQNAGTLTDALVFGGPLQLRDRAPVASGAGIASRRVPLAGPNRGGLDFYTNGAIHMSIDVTGLVTVPTLKITGGSDFAEPFAMSSDVPAPGSVVIIDDKLPGQLKLSERAYDRRVAGVISGAGGIQPGITLRSGREDGGSNVALSGRVYALADATKSPIRPGDLLTSSDRPGYCMKVVDIARGRGAVLGKAMTALDHGEGLVLVLVALQ